MYWLLIGGGALIAGAWAWGVREVARGSKGPEHDPDPPPGPGPGKGVSVSTTRPPSRPSTFTFVAAMLVAKIRATAARAARLRRRGQIRLASRHEHNVDVMMRDAVSSGYGNRAQVAEHKGIAQGHEGRSQPAMWPKRDRG